MFHSVKNLYIILYYFVSQVEQAHNKSDQKAKKAVTQSNKTGMTITDHRFIINFV